MPVAQAVDDGGKAAIINWRYPNRSLAVFLFSARLYFFFFGF
jgi:hypothetical protein